MPITHLDDGKNDEDNHALAVDRTVFAFERTALAYFRTSATFLIAGLSLIKFFDSVWMKFFGLLMIPATVYMFVLGIQKFRELNRFIRSK